MNCSHCHGKGSLPIKEFIDGRLSTIGSHPCVCNPATVTVIRIDDDPTDRKPVWDAMSN